MLSLEQGILAVADFLQNSTQVVLLIKHAGRNDFIQSLIMQVDQSFIFFDITQRPNISKQLSELAKEQSPVFIFNHASIENYYAKYQLHQWQAKAIIICDTALLHPTLDPSLYFAPIKGNRIQRQLLSVLTLNLQRNIKDTQNELSLTKSRMSVHDLPWNTHFLNMKLMTNDPVMIQMLADHIIADAFFEEFLFRLLFASREANHMAIAAANAITALNYAKVPFSHMDLSHVCIPDADLQGGIFDGTNFSYADLSRCNFKNAYLSNAKFIACKTSGIYFGQLPYIALDESAEFCCVSNEDKYLAVYLAANAQVVIYDLSQNRKKIFSIQADITNDVMDLHPSNSILVCGENIMDQVKDKYGPQLWDIVTRKQINMPKCHQAQVAFAKFTRDGKYLLTIDNNGNVLCWRADNNYQQSKKLSVKVNYSRDTNIEVTDKFIINAEDAVISIIDIIEDKKVALQVLNHQDKESAMDQASRIRCSKNSQYIAIYTNNAHFIIWHIDGRLQQQFKGYDEQVLSLEFILNDEYLVTGSDNHLVRFWLLEKKQCVRELRGHLGEVNCVQSFFGGRQIVSVSSDGTARFWETIATSLVENPQAVSYKDVCWLCISPNGEFLMSFDDDNNFKLWSLPSGEYLYALQKCFDKSGARADLNWNDITCALFSHNSEYFAYSSGEQVRIWDIQQNKYYSSLQHDKSKINSVCFTADSSNLVVVGSDNNTKESIIIRWDFISHNMLEKYIVSQAFISTMNISPNDQFLAYTALKEGESNKSYTLYVWDMAKTQRKIDHHKYPIRQLSFSHDSKLLAVYSSADTLKIIDIWDVENLTLVCKINENKQFFWTSHSNRDCLSEFNENKNVLEFSSDAKHLISGEIFVFPRGKTLAPLRVWSASTGKLIGVINIGNITCHTIRCLQDEIMLVSANDSEKSIRCWTQTNYSLKKSKWCLLWTSNPLFSARKCQLQHNLGLSPDNAELLKQHGGIT
jgi:WD40 repeat protein